MVVLVGDQVSWCRPFPGNELGHCSWNVLCQVGGATGAHLEIFDSVGVETGGTCIPFHSDFVTIACGALNARSDWWNSLVQSSALEKIGRVSLNAALNSVELEVVSCGCCALVHSHMLVPVIIGHFCDDLVIVQCAFGSTNLQNVLVHSRVIRMSPSNFNFGLFLIGTSYGWGYRLLRSCHAINGLGLIHHVATGVQCRKNESIGSFWRK